MSVNADIARRAFRLASVDRALPPEAWRAALCSQYTDTNQLRNQIKHTCPRSAFLWLCQAGLLPGVPPRQYTRSVKSSGYARTAVEQLMKDPSLTTDKARLETRVYGDRTPNGEVDVVLAFWGRELYP